MQKSFGLVLRQTALCNTMWIRGPKKAKAEAIATSDDLINIWKARKEPEIKDIDEYPLWLLELGLPLHGIHTVSSRIACGNKHYYPPASHVRSMIRSMKRDRISQNNIYEAVNAKGDVIGDDDLNDQEDQLEHIQQEKAAAEAAAEEAARLAELEEDDEDSPKAKKPAIKKEADDDDDKPAGKAGDKAAAGKGGAAAGKGAAAGAAGGADKAKKK